MPRGDLPDVSVRVNNSALPAAAQADLRAVTVEEDLAALSMFTLELGNWDDTRLEFSWSDSPLFAVGNEVEIWLGHTGDLAKVMLAEITSLEPVFRAGQPSLLMVRGYDQRYRLKDSAIAGQIAREAGLRAQVEDTKVTLGYVIQSNQSDWEFLRRRAGLIGYEIYVRDKVLYFRWPPTSAPPADKLSLGVDITEFNPRLSTLAQVSDMTVRGWNVREKKAVAATARAAPGGDRASGAVAARRAFGPASENIVGQPVRSVPEADPIARGQFNDMTLAYVAGEAVAHGRPRLRAGTVVDISGAGQTFSGPYYVTSVTHTVTPEHGYQTSFTVQRNVA
jgi:Bacteriophage probable baseplate hub protein